MLLNMKLESTEIQQQNIRQSLLSKYNINIKLLMKRAIIYARGIRQQPAGKNDATDQPWVTFDSYQNFRYIYYEISV